MLKQRTLSALIMVPVVVGALYFGSIGFLVLIAVIAGCSAIEYRNMLANPGIELSKLVVPICAAIALSGYMNRIEWFLASIVAGSLVLLATSVKRGVPNSVFSVAGAIYIGGLLGSLSFLRSQPDGMQWSFLVVFVTWANDVGAYFGGKAFGRRKMAPAVSPGKSWEGAVFGLVSGTVVSLYFGRWLGFTPLVSALTGVCLAVLAQIGDLVESGLKRYCQVKDSGTAIPGHGGFLDRFDSLLFAGAGGLLMRGLYGLLLHP